MNGARSPVTASRWGGDDRGARAHLLPLAEHGCELAELSFPRVDGVGCVRVRTNLYSAPAKPRTTVEVRLYPAPWKCATKAAVSPATNGSSKCSSSNTSSMCWSASRGRWPAQNHSRRGGNEDYGRRVMTGYSNS